MSGSIEQITQQITALEQQIEALGETFFETYRSYLSQLGQAVRRQLILSCYHVCTEGYPKRFLALSLNQRQQLQDKIREIAEQTEAELMELLRPIAETTIEPIEVPDELEALLDDSAELETTPEPPLTPLEALTIWQDRLERATLKTLKSASSAANDLLQEAEILPKRIPQPVLDAAAKAEGTAPGTPNLLNVLVDASEKSTSSDKPPALNALMHVVAVNLRLAELEFNDSALMTWRNKLRELKKQFQTQARDYQKKRREHVIAEAQLVWKSTWSNR